MWSDASKAVLGEGDHGVRPVRSINDDFGVELGVLTGSPSG
jgi:hypothetical protein